MDILCRGVLEKSAFLKPPYNILALLISQWILLCNFLNIVEINAHKSKTSVVSIKNENLEISDFKGIICHS